MNHPTAYRQWLEHDVRTHHVPLFEGLDETRLDAYWEVMERKYLDRYEEFLRLEFEFAASGLVSLRYPGALANWPIVELKDYGIRLPWTVAADLEDWVRRVDDTYFDDDDPGRWQRHAEVAADLALRIGAFLPREWYFEFHWLRQIVLTPEGVVELPVDEELRECLGR